MKSFLTVLFCIVSLLLNAQQEQKTIDSLLQKAKTVAPAKKIYVYDQVAQVFYRNQTDSAIKYTRLTLQWALRCKDTNNIGYAHTFLGVLYKNKGLFDSSLHHYFRAIRFQQADDFEKGMAGNYNNMATIYKMKGRYDQAIVHYHKALHIFSRVKDYHNMNIVIQNLAELYLEMGEEEKARQELIKAEKFYQSHPQEAALGYLYQSFGEIYQREKKYAKAGSYFRLAMVLFNRLHHTTDLVKAQIALAKLMMEQERFASGDSLIRMIKTHFADVPSGYDSAEVQLLEARIHLSQKKYIQVNIQAQLAIETAQRVQAQVLVMQAYDLLAQSYEKLNDPKKALFYFKQYKYLEDSIHGLERQKNIAELETRYQVSEKEGQIIRLRDSARITQLENTRTSLQLQNQETRNRLLWILALTILVFLVVFYIRYRQKRTLSKQLQSSLSERELLIREIHHRVKNNLQIVSSLLNLQLNRDEKSDIRSVIQLSQDRIHTMAMIHEKLYQSSNLENISIEEYMKGMCSYYEASYGLDNRNIVMTCEVDSPNLHIDQLVPVGLVLNELLINSMKHAFDEKGGNIAIGCHYAAELIIFTVRDNGRGLPPGYQQNMKNSLGLQLVQGLTKQLKGVLEIKNHDGAVFELRFKPRFK